MLYTVHFTAFCSGGPFFPGHGVYTFESIPLGLGHYAMYI